MEFSAFTDITINNLPVIKLQVGNLTVWEKKTPTPPEPEPEPEPTPEPIYTWYTKKLYSDVKYNIIVEWNFDKRGNYQFNQQYLNIQNGTHGLSKTTPENYYVEVNYDSATGQTGLAFREAETGKYLNIMQDSVDFVLTDNVPNFVINNADGEFSAKISGGKWFEIDWNLYYDNPALIGKFEFSSTPPTKRVKLKFVNVQ